MTNAGPAAEGETKGEKFEREESETRKAVKERTGAGGGETSIPAIHRL
jgi:hypothetical protein